MATMTAPSRQDVGEHELRRLIDRSVSRALFDSAFATRMLADPTVVLGDTGCTPQQRRDLRTIRARTVLEFAERARELFWLAPLDRVYEQDVALTAAAM
jgi:hypothetical protein